MRTLSHAGKRFLAGLLAATYLCPAMALSETPASSANPFTKSAALAAQLTPGGNPAQPSRAAFEKFLVYVYQRNPQLVAERQSLQIEDEHVSQAYAGFRPSVGVTGAAGRQREAVAGQNWSYGADTSLALVATQPIFNGFGTLAQYRAAKARVEAGRARLLATEQRVLFGAIGVWLDLCEKSRLLAYNADNMGRMYRLSDASQARFKAGDATQTDLAQSESRLADGESRYAQAEADWEKAKAAYIRLTGVNPPIAYFPPFVRDLPRDAEESARLAHAHPELEQSYKEEAAAGHDVDAASSSIWPSIYLRGEMNENRSPELGLERLRDDNVTINISIPLYQGGAEYSRVREAKLARERDRELSLDTLKSVEERARQSWYDYRAACEIIRATRRAGDAAGRALSGVETEQGQGLRTTLDVLNAQSELLNSQTAELQAEKTTRLEGYRLLASVGRLTAEGLHLTTVRYEPAIHYEDTAKRAIGF